MEVHHLSRQVNFFSLLCSSSLILLCMSMMVTNMDFLVVDANKSSDRLALLSFKSEITQDPLGILSSWNKSLHYCKWEGVGCSVRHPDRVNKIVLISQRLVGKISPHIGNLSFLRNFVLPNNSFTGEIPQEVGRLFRLKRIHLGNNSLEGQIPVNISGCINLKRLILYTNNLVGRIPNEIGYLSKLETLSLSYNNLLGELPSSLGNLSSLDYLSVSFNMFKGSIPSALSKLTSLKELHLTSNNMSGTIPPSLYNLSSLETISFTMNQFQGRFPSTVGLNLPNLHQFSVYSNNFVGVIPESITNSSKLEILQFSANYLVGSVPDNFGHLKYLIFFSVAANSLGNRQANDMSFLASLINCTSLVTLLMDHNNFGGTIPSSIANLTTKLSSLQFSRNQISGSIPAGFQNLVGLTSLGLDFNMLTGSIPTSIGDLSNLGELRLDANKLSGSIPSSFGNLMRLTQLGLAQNNLIGTVPSSLGNCKSLLALALNDNKLSGRIPDEVIGLSSLSILLNLSNNFLTGSIPLAVGKLRNLAVLDLSENKLSGEIPSTIGECSSLTQLGLGGNFFQGNISSAISSLKGLEMLSLSHNNFSGMIPKELADLQFLRQLDLSFNNLEGKVPRDGVFKNSSAFFVDGNNKLCGGLPALRLPDCPVQLEHKKKSLSPIIIIIIVAGVVLFSIFLVILLIFVVWKKKSKVDLPSTNLDVGNQYLGVSYNELLKATNGFDDSTNLLGVGSFGTVYSGILHQDESRPVAVKVLNLQRRGAAKSFIAECDTLRKVRHRNLVKIITCCSSTDFRGNDFKALVFELMNKGSLEKWLHPTARNINNNSQLQPENFSLKKRLHIAVDVASALDYLHHHCQSPIVHCDLKPSNILLDDDLVAHVGDFGLAKLLGPSSNDPNSSSIAIRGSIGYVAPEYGMGGEVSTQGDVYSYGILLLEMLTGKRPTDEMFKDGSSLHNFSMMHMLPEQVLNIVDPRSLEWEREDPDGNDIINHNVARSGIRNKQRDSMTQSISSIVQIGVVCSSELASNRPSMGDVIVEVQAITNRFLGVGIS